ncbi:MAG: hypothetical protein ABJH68_08200 [Ilumatobacter sp.]|uniref:hypothetical protein n=1 Tax=Ilumatobacter sp. TaxID=1967498 RepID=UPI003296A138
MDRVSESSDVPALGTAFGSSASEVGGAVRVVQQSHHCGRQRSGILLRHDDSRIAHLLDRPG